MLNQESLIKKIKELKPYYYNAYKEAFRQMFSEQSDVIDEAAEKFADNMTMNNDALAEAWAGIIDYYVRSIGLSGTIITQGGPSTQTAQISFMPQNDLNGKIPNTIGIS